MREDEPELLEALGFPPGRGACVATLHRVYRALDVDAFEMALGNWLHATGIAPDEPLALDGKPLRGAGGQVEEGDYVPGVPLVAAYAHQAQAILAQRRTSGKGQELAAAREVLARVPLAGRGVTADALLTQRDVCDQIVVAEGDYRFPVKENQPALVDSLERAFPPPERWQPSGADGTGEPGEPPLPPWYVAVLRRAAPRRPPQHRGGPAHLRRAARRRGHARPLWRSEMMKWPCSRRAGLTRA